MSLALRINHPLPVWPPLPYILCWGGSGQPLPVKTICAPSRPGPRLPGSDAPPWLATGPSDRPFDFCGHVRRLCADITGRCETLHHIDLSRVLFAVTQSRNGRSHGLQARVTPLRFRNGALRRRHGTVTYQVQRYFVDNHEILYVMTFCLPRFLNLDFDGKFVTLFHELYHISPAFDGDLRRHNGRYAIHSHSQCQYDKHMAGLARDYLAGGADPDLHGFLRLTFTQLHARHGSVGGISVPRPKLVPILGE